MPHILVVTANFYTDLADTLTKGAVDALYTAKATHEVVYVPGALEIAPTIRYAMESRKYDGYVALGCVIRGETSHYETVCEESARGLTWLAMEFKAAVGNGILTVENEEQAWARANVHEGNKGRDTAEACLRLVELKQKFGVKV